MKKIFLILSFAVFWTTVFSQNKISDISNIQLTQVYSNLVWPDFVEKVEGNFSVHFYYLQKDLPKFRITFNTDSISLKKLLKVHLLPYNVFVSTDEKGNIFLTKNQTLTTKFPTNFFKVAQKQDQETNLDKSEKNFIQTTKEYITETRIVGNKEDGVNKQIAAISGYAINRETLKEIEGATILDLISGKGVITDENGFYKIKLNIGKHIFKISSVNIQEKQIEIDLQSDGTLNLTLADRIILLRDVIISAEKDSKVTGLQMGLDKVSTKNIKKIPLVFGEKDIVKVALLLPGVQTVGEGASGFNVRGSPTDQNLFYINNIPIYNTSHLSGFFSAFNADVIDEFALFKSNIPLQYGGRIASVFEIKAKTGNKDRVTARGGIGPITGRLTVEGPLKKQNSSFLIGTRSTYSNWIFNLIKDPIIKNSKAQFSDIVTNFSFQLNKNDHLNAFTYYSRDKMDLYTQTKYNYQNYGASVVWKHYFQNKNSFDLSIAHSGYQFKEDNSQLEIASYHNHNQIGHSELKAFFEIVPLKNHRVQIGVNSILYNIDKGIYDPLTNASFIEHIDLGTEIGIESALFLSDVWKVNPKLTFSGGLRINSFTYFGPQYINKYRDDLPLVNENIVEVLHFNNWEAIKTYGGVDFRFGVNHLIGDNISIKATFDRLHQYIYMLSNTIAVSPNYKWKLSDYNTKPIIGDQISLGLYSNLWNKTFEFSVETYYKFTQNIVEIKDGANLFFTKNLEQATLQGNLSSYGVEFMLKKLIGNLSGWVNYTYSSSGVIVDSQFAENRINYGRSYPSNYDKPHAFNLIVNYDFSRRVSFSTNVIYSTGRPITYPTSVYYYGGIPTLNYSSRNAYRIPDYFRVDLSLNIEGNLLKRKLAHGSWSLSVYNALGRKNAFSVYFKEDENKIKAYKLSIFGAPIFSLTYNFKLGNYDSE